MNDIKILYYLKSESNDIFIELKRLKYKEAKDKSKYVSWFKINNKKPMKLNFIKMNNNIRYFEEGKLIIDDDNQIFIDNNKSINLKYCYINIDIIQRCLDIRN